jgi:hypothetical protein
MTGYRTFEGISGNPVVWVQFGFVKKPSLPTGFIKKYKSKGFNYYSNFHYNHESFRGFCNNLELSFKNLNVLL